MTNSVLSGLVCSWLLLVEVIAESNPSFKLSGFAELPAYESCAVVGSSGQLLAWQYGAWIDTHDAVFRSNVAPTIGFENAVGNKTNVRVCNGHKWDCAFDFEAVDFIVPKAQSETVQRAALLHSHRKPMAIPATQFLKVIMRVYHNHTLACEGHDVIHCRPRGDILSTGILAAAVAMSICQHVDIIGYDAPSATRERINHGNSSSPYHYYDSRLPKQGFSATPHDFAADHESICSGRLLGYLPNPQASSVTCHPLPTPQLLVSPVGDSSGMDCAEIVRWNADILSDRLQHEPVRKIDAHGFPPARCRSTAPLIALLKEQPFVVLPSYLTSPVSTEPLPSACYEKGEGGDLRYFGCERTLSTCRGFNRDKFLAAVAGVKVKGGSTTTLFNAVNGSTQSGGGWHVDCRPPSTKVKALVYMTDVSSLGDGPFEMLVNYKENQIRANTDKRATRYDDATIEGYMLQNSEARAVQIYGPPGTVVLFRISNIHRGNPHAHGHPSRLALTNYYHGHTPTQCGMAKKEGDMPPSLDKRGYVTSCFIQSMAHHRVAERCLASICSLLRTTNPDSVLVMVDDVARQLIGGALQRNGVGTVTPPELNTSRIQRNGNIQIKHAHDAPIETYSYKRFFAWKLTQYDAILYFDTDMFIQKNISYMFEQYPPYAGIRIKHRCRGFDYTNAGLMLFRPSDMVSNALLNTYLSGNYSFCGGSDGGYGNQDVIINFLFNPNAAPLLGKFHEMDICENYRGWPSQRHCERSSVPLLHGVNLWHGKVGALARDAHEGKCRPQYPGSNANPSESSRSRRRRRM